MSGLCLDERMESNGCSERGLTESDDVAPLYDNGRLPGASSDDTFDLFSGLEIHEEKVEDFQEGFDLELKDDIELRPSDDDEESSDEDPDEKRPLSKYLHVYPNKKLTAHGHVLEGEITSDLIGAHPCAIKFSDHGGREASILQKLGTHTHVICLIQSGPFSDGLRDTTFLALERCHELNLRQCLLRDKENEEQYDNDWSMNVCKQILNGLKYIHDKFVIHKDLKPSNVLLTHDLKNIKIADFGSSHLLKSSSSMTYCPNMFGTLGYRPPESFGRSYASLKSDIYSLGVLLYFLLSYGESPFGVNEDLWDHNVISGRIELARLRVENPETSKHLIQSMLASDRCHRPSIWQVEAHPCWSGEEADCSFEYGFQEEVDDCDVIGEEPEEPEEPFDLAEQRENDRQAIQILQKIIPRATETFLLFFDRLTWHLKRFNPRTNLVREMHEMNDDMKKKLYAPVALGDHIYVIMDNRRLYRLNYRQRTAQWQQMADINYDHGWFPPSVVADGKIYVVGRVSGTFTKTVSRYDPNQNGWEQVTNKNLAARDAAITSSDQFVYCLGGWIDGVGASNKVERLDVKTLLWDEIAPMLEARYYGTALECEGNLYAFGGRSRKTVKMNTVEKYTPNTDQWVTIKPMTQTRAGSWFRCQYVEGCIFAISGDYDETIEKYGFKEGWEKVKINGPKMDIYSSVVIRMTS